MNNEYTNSNPKVKSIVALTTDLTNAGTNASAVHQTISDILAARSWCLHLATSDKLVSEKKTFADYAKQLNSLLVKAFCQLPDKRPGLPYSISVNGKFMLLQSVDDDDALYVSPSKFDEAKFYNHRLSRIERIYSEMEATSKTVEAILALEAVEVSPVEADDADETAAIITHSVLG